MIARLFDLSLRQALLRSGGGVFVSGMGLLGLVLALPLNRGSMAQMGPGFMPVALALLVIAAGIVVLVADLQAPDEPAVELRPLWRPLVLILASVALFGLLIERAGLLAAIIACVGVSSLAEPGQKLHEIVLLIAGLAAFCGALFIALLGMTIRLI